MKALGVIAIGRNEGERLRRCLESVMGHGLTIVYVDSGSVDGSLELARSLGADVVELDLITPVHGGSSSQRRLRSALSDQSPGPVRSIH